jgi:hypothetical protein
MDNNKIQFPACSISLEDLRKFLTQEEQRINQEKDDFIKLNREINEGTRKATRQE